MQEGEKGVETPEGGVTREVAEKDINRWLDYRRIRKKKREKNEDGINELIELVEDGIISVDEDCNITLELQQPIKNATGSTAVQNLVFKPRLKQQEVSKHLKGAGTDVDARVSAYIAAATEQSKGVLSKLDVSDYNIAQSIALFFLV